MADGAGRGSVLTDGWVAGLVDASLRVEVAGRRSGVVEFTIGKTERAVIEIADGRVVGVGDDHAIDVSIPTTVEQLSALIDGSESLAQAYMRGDIKPVGSTGALLALVELFECDEFRQHLPPLAAG